MRVSVPRSKYGIHIANSGNPSLDRLLTVGFSAYFGLHINLDSLYRIRDAQPDAHFIVRWFDEDIMGDGDPRHKAQEMVDWAYATRFYNLVPGNELNLRCEHKYHAGHGEKENWDTYEDYEAVEAWLLELLRCGREYDVRGLVRWGRPPESPGHSEDNNDNSFVVWRQWPGSLLQYDFVTIHSYWDNPEQFPSEWYGQRWRKKLALLRELGVVSPVFITETNRKWNHAQGSADALAFRDELLTLYRQVYEDPQIAAVYHFIWASQSTDFYDLCMVDQGGVEQPVVEGMRRAEKPVVEESVTYYVGEGFKKCAGLVGPWTQDELYHWSGTENETSLAVGAKGYATWRRTTNETVCVTDSGEVWTDHGNQGDGTLRRVS